jgi:hypothetical protein
LQSEPSYQSWRIIWILVQLILFFIIVVEYKWRSSWYSKQAIENAFGYGLAQLWRCIATMFMQKIQNLSENAMLDFLNTVALSAQSIVDMADLLWVPDANLFAHRQQSQYSNAKPRLQGMPITSGRGSILQFFRLLVVSRTLHLRALECFWISFSKESLQGFAGCAFWSYQRFGR